MPPTGKGIARQWLWPVGAVVLLLIIGGILLLTRSGLNTKAIEPTATLAAMADIGEKDPVSVTATASIIACWSSL